MRAARLLATADVLFYDALVHPETVALATRAQKFAVGKRCGRHSTAQQFINKRLVDAARTHRVVVRLKGGDPMLFGRAQEEIAALEAHGIACAVVPGITAALAAAAELKTSLTQRGVARSVTFATPRKGADMVPGEWARALGVADAGAIYMGAGEAAAVTAALLAAGKAASLPVAVIENASLPQCRIVYTTLGELPSQVDAAMTGPALILLGPQFRARAQVLHNANAAVMPTRRAAA
jgi:uroporphyrin-III C-methyltransferase